MKNNCSNKINFSQLSKSEKVELKSRINHSVYTYILRRRKWKYYVAVAASIIIVISVGFLQTINTNDSSIENFVKTSELDDLMTNENIKLVLTEDQDVEIKENNSIITYSKNGEEVKIGNSKSVSQKTTKNNDIVFNTLIVPYGKRSEITLADGTKVWLNSGTKLVFPVSFTGETREVYIEGEAIFEVAHDKSHPFIVKANNHDIEVLGTVFNVSNYKDDDNINTVLKSGSVQITCKVNSYLKPKTSVTLSPNTLATYNKNSSSITTKTVDVEKYFSWRDGVFIFKNDALSTIAKKISRYYNVDIEIKNKELSNETFSGYLDVKDNVENVLNIIKETTKFQYEIIDNRIIIN